MYTYGCAFCNAKETHSVWRNIIRRNANNVLLRVIFRGIERETRLARKHSNKPLLRRERPRKRLRAVRIEVDFNSVRVLHRDQTLSLKAACANVRRPRETSCRAEHAVKRNGGIRDTQSCNNLRGP